jgi:hypothetical protein
MMTKKARGVLIRKYSPLSMVLCPAQVKRDVKPGEWELPAAAQERSIGRTIDPPPAIARLIGWFRNRAMA